MATSSPTLQQLISSDSLLREYFRANGLRQQAELAVELLREAISARMQAVPGKHYHVAYIKHNRFLGPTQKQEVTEKVTQIVPVNEKPVKIYAKPKPRPQENESLQIQSEKEIETREEIASREVLPEPTVDKKVKRKAIESQNELDGEESKREESEKYLSPKTKPKQEPVKDKPKAKEFASPPSKPAPPAYHSPRAAQSTGGLKIESNFRSAVKERQEMGSPKLSREDYGRVESKIKFLIDRDKQSKRMEMALQAQGHKIEKLEARQERLLLLQYEQERELLRANYPRPRDSLSESGSDCSSDEPGRLDQISERLQAINSRAEGVREYQDALYASLEKMRDKTYKISSNPVYPISSSSDEDL